MAAAAKTVAVSAPVAEWVRAKTDPDHHARIWVVPNGVNTERIRPATGNPDGPPVVVFVGTLKPWHGVDVLLEAAARAEQDWQLRIIGDGPLGAALRARATALGLRAEFVGAVAPAQIPAGLANCAVAVAPYPATAAAADQYFSPLKIFEYSAAALPVVASRVGQIPAIVDDGVTGLLVPPSDPAALAAAIDGLVADPNRRAAMAAAARTTAVTEHSWHQVLDRILDGVTVPTLTALPTGERRPT